MSGIFIKLNDVLFGSGTPVSPSGDPTLTDGSLLLAEPARDRRTGIPTRLINYASELAAAQGVSDPGEISITDTLTAEHGVMERTLRGGLHGIITPGPIPSDRQYLMRQPGVMAYLSANPTHEFAMFAILKVTRDAEPGGDNPNPLLVGSIVPAFNFFQSSNTKNIGAQPGAATRTGFSNIEDPQSGSRLVGVGSVLSGTSASGSLSGWGGQVRRTEGQPSFILYRLYMEDLTLSGRSFAQVQALEERIFEARFAPGGRYADDSFADPAATTF